MSINLSPTQVLFIWRLLVTGEEPAIKDIKPKLTAPQRNQLKLEGLIEEVIRKGKIGRSRKHVLLTDKAWAWATDHMDATVSRSKLAGAVLQEFLTRLKPCLDKHNISLAEILSPPKQPSSQPDLESRVHEAYFRLSGGKANVRVRLAQLRQALPDVGRDTLDGLLLKLQRAEKLVLYPLDNPREIAPEDVQAAITFAGFSNHIVYMRK
jgi:hypothetical protein